MGDKLKLMCVLAHPDDEAMGFGGTLAYYAAEGVETYVVTATRGERGWQGPAEQNPGLEGLGKIREGELRAAAEKLKLTELILLNYIDGELDAVDSLDATRQIAGYIRHVKPQVVLTFDPFGAYGHPDHIAISQYTSSAIVAAADASYTVEGGHAPHRVQKMYYLTDIEQNMDLYTGAFGEFVMRVDSVDRTPNLWPVWAVSARVDGGEHWEQVWEALICHKTQIPPAKVLRARLTPEQHRELWGIQYYYRAMSMVNGGRKLETDLFEGLR